MGCRKKTISKNKSKSMVCVICKGDKKVRAKKKCCPQNMTARKKGSWNL